MGSSFLPAEINAAFLWAQLENLDEIQNKRKQLWNCYYERLSLLGENLRKEAGGAPFSMPDVPDYASNNAHMFYLVCRNLEERTGLIAFLKEHGVLAPFHYVSLHKSEYYKNHSDNIPELPLCDMYADCLVRMPMFYDLEVEQVVGICKLIKEYYANL